MSEETPEDRRTIRAPDELWKPFLALARVARQMDGSTWLRELIQAQLADYAVFWAPEHKDIDPQERPVPWFECEEHQDVHRLLPDPNDPRTQIPWGCSVIKSRQDRLDKEKENAK